MDIDRYSASRLKTWTGSHLGVEDHPCGKPWFEPLFAGLAGSFEHAQLVCRFMQPQCLRSSIERL